MKRKINFEQYIDNQSLSKWLEAVEEYKLIRPAPRKISAAERHIQYLKEQKVKMTPSEVEAAKVKRNLKYAAMTPEQRLNRRTTLRSKREAKKAALTPDELEAVKQKESESMLSEKLPRLQNRN